MIASTRTRYAQSAVRWQGYTDRAEALEAAGLSRTDDVLADQTSNQSLALTEGFQSAFLVAVAIAALGGVLALLLFGRKAKAAEGVVEAAPALEHKPVIPCCSRGFPASVPTIAKEEQA